MTLTLKLFIKMATLIVACNSFIHCSSGNVDVLVIGGGTSGTAAAIQAARSGVRVMLTEETEWLGGMLTSAGVSATDGCYNLRGGIWAEFRDSLEAWYGSAEALNTGWVSNILFEPSVGNRIFMNMASRENNLSVCLRTNAVGFEKTRRGWKVTLEGPEGNRIICAKILVDATELGDVAKSVGIPYEVGMDAASETGEAMAPQKKNSIVQDITYSMILKDYGHPVPMAEPDDYSPSEFACCCRNLHCNTPKEADRVWSKEEMITYGKLPCSKYMINWPCEGNDFYIADIVDATPEQRAAELEQAKKKSLRFLYFLQKELGFVNLNLADDEYPTVDRMPFLPYYRESRRIEGRVQFTVNDIVNPHDRKDKLYRTGIAVGDYPIDQHHTQYSGWEDLPNLYFSPVPSFSLPVGVMMPKKYDDMLVIEKSISVTNIVNGTTRLQPVVLQLGQAAGIVAAEAVKNGCGVSEVSVREAQKELLEAGTYLVPLLDLQPDSPYFKPLQRIALTGIIRYTGLSVNWSNQSWIYADSLMRRADLIEGMSEFYSGLKRADGSTVSFDGLAACSCAGSEVTDATFIATLLRAVTGSDSGCSVSENPPNSTSVSTPVTTHVPLSWLDLVISCLTTSFGKEYCADTPLDRLECAVVLDTILDPFGTFDVDLHGHILP